MTPRQAHEELTKLQDSPIWRYIRSTMEAEILDAARLLAQRRPMSQSEIDFQRGAIWAADQLLNLPGRLAQKLEAQIIIEESRKRDDSKPDRLPKPLSTLP